MRTCTSVGAAAKPTFKGTSTIMLQVLMRKLDKIPQYQCFSLLDKEQNMGTNMNAHHSRLLFFSDVLLAYNAGQTEGSVEQPHLLI